MNKSMTTAIRAKENKIAVIPAAAAVLILELRELIRPATIKIADGQLEDSGNFVEVILININSWRLFGIPQTIAETTEIFSFPY